MKVYVILYQDKLGNAQTKGLLLLSVAASKKLAKEFVEKTVQANNSNFKAENFEIHETEMQMGEPIEEEICTDEVFSEHICGYCHTPLPVNDCHYAVMNDKHYHLDCLRRISE